MPKITTADQALTDKYKFLETPSKRRTIKVVLTSDGGKTVYVSDARRAKVLERADRIMTRERNRIRKSA